ncbi:IS66 family insertion sequence element accessory protein TnpB [Bryobacter aggregatus]|uniref:IS66 family insertion sequence element accessory protein TnpB n=1 Tax=Bryobacter aggregatus TaxID=360054 RepID=UPI00192E5AB8|nr:IS66 family insertion sequence element accessory protein TnpB [Bryobacter aggregatus]
MQIWIVAGRTDMRRNFTGLSAIVQQALSGDPFSGQAFAFCGHRGDLIKVAKEAKLFRPTALGTLVS